MQLHLPFHTPSIAFWHLPQNCQNYLCTAGHKCWRWPPKGLSTDKTGSNVASKYAHKHEAQPPRVKKNQCHLDSNNFGCICAGVNNVGSYKRNVWYNLSCLLQTNCWAVIKEMSDIIWVVHYKWTAIWAPRKNCLLADSFWRPMT